MAAYAIGDVQGCHFSFLDLLSRIKFNSDCDQIFFVGDLVNRGKNSKLFAEWCLSNQANIKTVLGNHDLHFMAVYFGQKQKNKSDTLDGLLSSKKISAFIEWIYQQPLVFDYENYLIVHAGIYPHWTIAQSIDLSKKVHEELIAEPEKFLFKMYGNAPGFWRDDLGNFLKLRMTINIMTRMRMLNKDLSLEYNYKGEISKINHDKFYPKPWFDFKRLDSSKKIITGHWSAIDICRHQYGISIDSGCVWGNALTAFCLDTQELFQVPAHPDDLII